MAATAGAAIAWSLKLALPPTHPILVAAATLIPYGLVYFGVTFWSGVPEARALLVKWGRG
jgi:hypothetical protein